MQTLGVHWHAAVPPDAETHVWCAPQVDVVTHCVQPLGCILQVCAAPGVHWVVPSVHAFVQVCASDEASRGASDAASTGASTGIVASPSGPASVAVAASAS